MSMILALIACFLSCVSGNVLKGLEILDAEAPDSLRVRRGRVSGFLQAVPKSEVDSHGFQAVEKAVSEHQDRLERWALDLTGLRVEDFRFTFAARRKADGALVVRYFAQTTGRDPIYAGVQVQFVISPATSTVRRMFLDRVPYES